MEHLIDEVVKNPSHNYIWALVVWVLAREFLPALLKKFRNGKTPYLEIIKEKVDFLYLREKKRETIEEYKATQRTRRSTDKTKET